MRRASRRKPGSERQWLIYLVLGTSMLVMIGCRSSLDRSGLGADRQPDEPPHQLPTPRPPTFTATREPLITASPGPAATTAARPTGKVSTGANFRSGPGLTFSILRTLPAGTEVLLSARRQEESGWWYQVLVDGQEGWLNELVLAVDPVLAATVPVQAEPVSVTGVSSDNPTESQTGGLGLSRSEAQRRLEQLGYVFEEPSVGHGVTVFTGTSASGRVTVHLFSISDQLQDTTIKVSEALHSAERDQDIAALVECVHVLVPDWAASAGWIPGAIDQARVRQTPQSIDLAGTRTVMLSTGPHMILLTIKPKL